MGIDWSDLPEDLQSSFIASFDSLIDKLPLHGRDKITSGEELLALLQGFRNFGYPWTSQREKVYTQILQIFTTQDLQEIERLAPQLAQIFSYLAKTAGLRWNENFPHSLQKLFLRQLNAYLQLPAETMENSDFPHILQG